MLGQYRERIARISDPVARVLLRLRVRPNQLTVLGLCCSAVAAAAFATDRQRVGGMVLALAGIVDLLDGAVARASGQVSPFGAFLDSVLDRYSDLLVLAGLVILFVRLEALVDVVATLAAMIGTVMVSYTRARAESVGVACRVGLMERGERLLTLVFGAVFGVLAVAVWAVAILANLTAIHRIVHTRRVTAGSGGR
jgi:CDP-diacylglycerol--glycerol-3-phosphate 3-phosphatidyltransferase